MKTRTHSDGQGSQWENTTYLVSFFVFLKTPQLRETDSLYSILHHTNEPRDKTPASSSTVVLEMSAVVPCDFFLLQRDVCVRTM